MRGRLRMLFALSITVISSAPANAQSVPAARDSLLIREQFTEPYRRARASQAADALPKVDPVDTNAVPLLVEARRGTEAVDLVERIRALRPELFQSSVAAIDVLPIE